MPSHLIKSIATAFGNVEYPQGIDISIPTYDEATYTVTETTYFQREAMDSEFGWLSTKASKSSHE